MQETEKTELTQELAEEKEVKAAEDATNSLMWKLTVYTDKDGKETGYYELQNTYLGRFLAPQLTNGQILSKKKIGIQMPGRKYECDDNGIYSYGEYYSSIVAWDKRYYDYASLKGVVDNSDPPKGNIESVFHNQLQKQRRMIFLWKRPSIIKSAMCSRIIPSTK